MHRVHKSMSSDSHLIQLDFIQGTVKSLKA